jgi:glycyl-tRNA synthetase beta subunit
MNAMNKQFLLGVTFTRKMIFEIHDKESRFIRAVKVIVLYIEPLTQLQQKN